jgi:predicted dehydrogenase
MKILILNGPNLNRLGRREPGIYGSETMEQYLQRLQTDFPDHCIEYYQSNHEGALIDRLQAAEDEGVEGVVLNAFSPELANGAMMDIGVYTIYPLVVLFGKPQAIHAQGVVLSSGVDGQGAVNMQYDGLNATVLYSKIANSQLPAEIEGEDGNILIDRIQTPVDVRFYPRQAPASGHEKRTEGELLSQPEEHNEYYYEVKEFIDLIEQGRVESEINSHENSITTLEIIDEVRRQLGVSYPADKE